MSSNSLHRGVDHVAVHCYDRDATVRFSNGATAGAAHASTAPKGPAHNLVKISALAA